MTSLALRTARAFVSYLPSSSLLSLRALPDRLRSTRPHESDFALLRKLTSPSLIVVDVGANRGQSIRSFRLFLDRPIIHAIEPNPMLAGHLADHADLGGGAIYNVALSDGEGTLVLHVPKYGHTHYDTRASDSTVQAESFLSADNFLFFAEHRAAVERLEVSMCTLDSLGLTPDILKIDVEGAELSVLQGGAATIQEHMPLMLIEEPCEEAVALAASWGYEAYQLVDGQLVSSDGSTLNTFFLAPAHRTGQTSLLT